MNKLATVVVFLALMGCASPAQRFNDLANKLGFSVQIVNTAQFQHKIYASNTLLEGEVLHVYIDGDGTPWKRKRWIADDPTARNPLILELMKQDRAASILLGRPCYYGLNHHSECHNKYWTSHRYSKEVVSSMASALNKWLGRHKFNEVVLIGYSGGGSLAVLMADKVRKIKKVVTVAANLNVQAWSEFHGYSTLNDSLNPSDKTEFKTAFQQIHFAGEDDDVVPAYIIKAYADQQKNAKYYNYANKDHACCWEQEWLNILNIINN